MESLEKFERAPTKLVEATENDIEALIDVERSVTKTNTYSPMTGEKAWKEELASNKVYLIKEGDINVGSIAYEEKTPEHIYISGIIVRPDYQGRGIATSAMKQVLERYPNATRFDLVTHPENPALSLYQSLGFQIESRVENYWGDGEPRLVLALNTSSAAHS